MFGESRVKIFLRDFLDMDSLFVAYKFEKCCKSQTLVF